MIARFGDRIAAVFRATMPDPFVLAVLLTLLTLALGVTLTDATPGQMLDAWQGKNGFWGLLGFGMQMCLILVTGHALASARPVAGLLRRAASIPRTGRQSAAMVAFCAVFFSLINWGLGLVVGAVLARDVGRRLRDRGVRVPYPLLAAAGYVGMMTWHGGMSGSAPLNAADPAGFAARVGPEMAAEFGGSIPISATLLSPVNLAVTGGMLLWIPLLFAALCPRDGGPDDRQPPSRGARSGPSDVGPVGAAGDATLQGDAAGRVPAWLERSPLTVWALAVPILLWLAPRFAERGVDAFDLNSANLIFLALGLILHGSAARYAAAVEDAARGCAGIILQFPLYAGIIGMMQDSGLAAEVSRWAVRAAAGSHDALAVITFLFAGLLNIFIPSGGGQWAVQGPIALRAALEAGAEPGRMVLAVAYGDQWTNMIQPFWALPLLGITGVKAREVVGYTALAMAAAGVWIVLCLWLI